MTVLCAGAPALAFMSLFMGMATDSCSGTNTCNDTLITGAYLLGWGGLFLAFVVAAVGMWKAVSQGGRLWPWPLLGWAITACAVVVFYGCLRAGIPSLQ